MQFNRSALIEAIDKAIQLEHAAIVDIHARNAAANDEHRREWLSLHEEKWMKATAVIRAKLRRGEPVVEEDIPRDRSGYTGKAYYRPKRVSEVPARAAELAGLRAVLDAVADEMIGTTALRSLGVGVNTLRMIVPLLGSATVRSETLKAVK